MTRFLYIFIINFADGYVKVPLQKRQNKRQELVKYTATVPV